MNICSIEGCAKRAEKRGWCAMHYRRWRVHGDTSITKKAANGNGYLQNGYLGHQVDGVRVFDHVRIAEKALGKPLPPSAVVHHVNEIKTDNRNENLVICPDRAYHKLIHARTDAYNATGDANAHRCRHCGTYRDQSSMRRYEKKRGTGAFVYSHPECDQASSRRYLERKKSQ